MKAVIFDFDYTLGDSSNGIVESINYALDKLGYDHLSKHEISKTIGYSLKDTFTILTGNDDEFSTSRFAKLFKERADEIMTESTVLYTYVIKLLELIRLNNCKIAIVTSKFHYRIEQILSKFGILSKIDVILGAEDVINEKPAPDGLLLALDLLEVGKEDCIYVGDSTVDAKAAQAAGIDFIAVLSGATERAQFDKLPTVYIARDISDVKDYLFGGDEK